MSSSPNDSSITLHGESTFEHLVRQLHLSPNEYATSAELKEWVRKNKDQRYVPTTLSHSGALRWKSNSLKK